MNNSNKKILYECVLQLEKNISNCDYIGFDPYDIKGSSFYIWALSLPRFGFIRNLFRKLVLAPLIVGESIFPNFFRWAFKVRSSRNAKGIGLITRGYLNLYKKSNNEIWLKKAISLLNWLEENKNKNYEFNCWGYPFDWFSGGGLVPANTPAAVVCSSAFDAFWDAWLIIGDHRYLDACKSICNFFLNNLNISYESEESICFSYTPLDNLQVQNINLMISDCLLRVGYALNDASLIDVGKKAANFALQEQNADGSLFYYGRSQNYIDPGRIDHYHSGFEMRSLHGIWKTTLDPIYRNALKKYYKYYTSNLLKSDGGLVFPLMYPGKEYPINIHSYAEAILLNSTLSNLFPEAAKFVDLIIPVFLRRMKKPNGDFRYMINKIGPLYFKSNISYMRWGQAWTFLALTQALLIDE
jgi:hypothetical protein